MALFSLDGSQGTGGSINSAQSYAYSDAYSRGYGQSSSNSATYGTEATILSAQQAENANNAQWLFQKDAQAYNALQAQIQRDWEEKNANTIYTRSVKNMIEAGINPILAYNMGLTGASVGSGAAANISTPSAFMGQTFADQRSASQSSWETQSESHSRSESKSNGSGWNNSESGLATGLAMLGKYLGDGLATVNSALNLNLSLGDMGETKKQIEEKYDKNIEDLLNFDTGNSKINNYRKKVIENNKKEVGNNPFLKLLNNMQLKATGLTK